MRRTSLIGTAQPLHGPDVPVPSITGVVIIGAGVIGLSIAYHLALAGVQGITVIERDRIGSGSSAKPLGGVRATFSDPGNITLGQRSLDAYARFEADFGVDIGLRRVGYLFVCSDEADLDALERSTRLQNALGGCSSPVTPAHAQELSPFLDATAIIGGSYSPRDGFAEPAKVVACYARAALDAGVTILEHTEVLDLSHTADAVTAVHTSHGTLRVDSLICAAGAWSEQIGRMAGVPLPVEPVRRQIGFTPPLRASMPTVPFTLDLASTLYFHNAGAGLLLGISDRDQQPGFDRSFSYSWKKAFDDAASAIAPELSGAPLVSGWAGLYENTPDHNALIGRDDRVSNFFYATGFSGHGFLQAPAVGELVADLHCGRDSFMSPINFTANRFERAAALSEVHII